MVTLSDLFFLIFLLVLITLGVSLGSSLGIAGAIAGGIAGSVIGFYAGRVPGRLMIRRTRRELARFTPDELRAQFHDPKCMMPNFLLLELRARGENITQELPRVLDLMESEHRHRRIFGYAALLSAFPGIAGMVKGYSPSRATNHCRQKVAELREKAAGLIK